MERVTRAEVHDASLSTNFATTNTARPDSWEAPHDSAETHNTPRARSCGAERGGSIRILINSAGAAEINWGGEITYWGSLAVPTLHPASQPPTAHAPRLQFRTLIAGGLQDSDL